MFAGRSPERRKAELADSKPAEIKTKPFDVDAPRQTTLDRSAD